MVKKISRDICLIKYRKLPLFEFEKESDEEVRYYPKINSFYWLKLNKNSEKNIIKEIVSLLKKLNIENLVFLGEMNKPWISKFTESRKDFKVLTKAIEYFKSHKIEKRFNGGVKVDSEDFEDFFENFYTITKCDGGFSDFNFVDENENFIFYIHYSGELKVLTLNPKSNKDFLINIMKTKFIDSERENTNRIE
jgi:hypothetical protein